MPIEAEVFVARFPVSTSVGVIAAAVGLVCVGPAWADDPLTFTASHNIAHDSNFARTETPISDTINTTSLELDLNKPYGRQVYTGSAKVSALRYSRYGELLNNDAKDLNLGFQSELMSNWRVMLDGAYGENLNQFENNRVTDHVVRNVRTNKNANAQVVYGIAGIWAVVGSAGKNVLTYSLPEYSYLNYHQDTRGLRAVYYSTDLLNYSLGVRQVETRYHQVGETVNENDLDLATDWVVTGLSQLHATLSLTSSKREMPAGSVVSDRRFNGLTGNLNWVYTPHGVMTYGATLYRTANSDQFNQLYLAGVDPSSGTVTIANGQTAYHNQMTAANLYATWNPTVKLAITASTQWNHFKVDNDYVGGVIVNDTSDYHAYSLNSHYMVERWLKLSAGFTRYSQTKDATRNQYSGHAVNVAASFILD
ncbi:MAG: hypothetical protein KGL57_11955 [Burkholderiales bacterium]|nr:hypothetical protein [Burkholderiales bacterium]